MKKMFPMRAIVVICLLLITVQSKTQVLIFFKPITDGQSVSRLAGLQLFNKYRSSNSCVVTITVREVRLGLLFKMVTPEFILPVGNSHIPSQVFNGSVTSYGTGASGRMIASTGLFPDGDYEYCIQVLLRNIKDPTITNDFFESCIPYSLQRMLPLQLINPADGDKSCNRRPSFQWQPMLPAPPGTSYTLLLAELLKGQTEKEALTMNRPLILQTGLISAMLPYPVVSQQLEEGKKYIWQIVAVNKDVVLTRSDIWQYQVSCLEDSVTETFDSYRELSDSRDAASYITIKYLRFVFHNPYNSNKDILAYSITDLTEPTKKIGKLPTVTLETGYNKKELNLQDISGFKEGHQYMIQLSLPGGGERYLRFIYNPSGKIKQ